MMPEFADVMARVITGSPLVVPGKLVECERRRWAKGRSFKHPVCGSCGQTWQAVLGTRKVNRRPQVGTSVPMHQVAIRYDPNVQTNRGLGGWVYPNGQLASR